MSRRTLSPKFTDYGMHMLEAVFMKRAKNIRETMQDQLAALRRRIDPAINSALTEHPEMTMNEIAKEHGVSWAWVSRVNREYGAGRKKGTGSPSHPQARSAAQRQ